MNHPNDVPFYFIFEAAPAPDNTEHADIAGGTIHFWIFARDIAMATEQAHRSLAEYGWVVTATTKSVQPRQEQLDAMDTQGQLEYQKAVRFGEHFQIDAWPKVPRPGRFEAIPLKKPPKD